MDLLTDYDQMRADMVKDQIEARGITDKSVIRVMREVPRHLFVPENMKEAAYSDGPLPIGYGQTISQPYMVAIMTELLELKDFDIVLELGTGSGYQAAIIAGIAKFVRSYERIPELAKYARENIERAGISNIEVICYDGTLPKLYNGGYHAAIVTAATPSIPDYLFPLMNNNGRIVAPVGDYYVQNLAKIRMENGKPTVTYYGGCRFVPLIGEKGWKE